MSNLYLVTLRWTWGAYPARTILCYETPSELDSVQRVGLVDGIADAIDAVKGNLSDALSISNMRVRRVDVNGFPSVTVPITAGTIAGTDTAQSMPTNVSALLSKYAETQRPNRGRIYMPGMTEATVNGNSLTGGVVTNLQTFCNAIRTVEYDTGLDADMVIPRWSLGNDYVGSWNTVQTLTAESLLATQRKRLR